MAGVSVKKSLFALDDEEEVGLSLPTCNLSDSGIAAHESTTSPPAATKNNNKRCENDEEDDGIQIVQDKTADNTEEGTSSAKELTAFQKAKIERNRQRALLLRQARLQAHPYKNPDSSAEHSVIRVQNSRLIDSGGGFLIDEQDLQREQDKEVVITENPAPILLPERPHCEECEQPINDSFLYRSFSYPVCDSCRDEEDKHSLITRTEARQEYLLKDCDLDLREPILRYILRKNPHNPKWGDMKLYLRSQIEDRALEIWETPEKLEEERELREAKKEKSKVKKFNKQVKDLRMAVRSSIYTKQVGGHEHVFNAEQYDSDRDVYFRTCKTCSHKQEYEKM